MEYRHYESGDFTSSGFGKAFVEEEDNFLYKMADTLSVFASNKDGPIVSVPFQRGFFSPLSRVAQNQLYLYGLREHARMTNGPRARARHELRVNCERDTPLKLLRIIYRQGLPLFYGYGLALFFYSPLPQ